MCDRFGNARFLCHRLYGICNTSDITTPIDYNFSFNPSA
nr:MAG TPA: hypothetical protein [Caudoviricetes sp.]